MSKHKILFATDIPFWQTSTGAEQRIASLHRYLSRDEYQSQVFYLGQVADSEAKLVEQQQVDLIQSTSDKPPEKLAGRIRWYADATINQARNWLNRETISTLPDNAPESLVLADFDWPWARTKFAETVEKYQPDTIIFEYIKTAYLMEALTPNQRKSIKCVVDTHDLLHRRAQQFFSNGFPHWLKIDRDEEAEVLNRFDVVMAIQNKEADLFREMAPLPKTITVGHAVEEQATPEPPDQTATPGKITIGYIGSKNFSNWQAIRNFLQNAWPSVLEKHSDKCDLLIAGAVCNWFEDESNMESLPASDHNADTSTSVATTKPITMQNVRMIGRIDEIMQFYDKVDVLINPVEFGTGLKIKNSEALRYGKLLITTRNGFDGMPEATRLACKVVEDVDEMGMAINSLCSDLSTIRKMQSLALQLSQTEFSEAQAYSELATDLIGKSSG